MASHMQHAVGWMEPTVKVTWNVWVSLSVTDLHCGAKQLNWTLLVKMPTPQAAGEACKALAPAEGVLGVKMERYEETVEVKRFCDVTLDAKKWQGDHE